LPLDADIATLLMSLSLWLLRFDIAIDTPRHYSYAAGQMLAIRLMPPLFATFSPRAG